MLAGNPKENLIRAIDAYVRADAQTPDTRAVCEQLRTIRQDVDQAPNPVARHTGARHADLIEQEARSQLMPEVHVHVHTGPTPDSQIEARVKERLRRA